MLSEFLRVYQLPAVLLSNAHISMEHFVINNEFDIIAGDRLPVEDGIYAYDIRTPAVASERPLLYRMSWTSCTPCDPTRYPVFEICAVDGLEYFIEMIIFPL